MAGSKKFGKKLKELREFKNLSQEQLAEKVGVEYQSISRIETGLYFTTYDNLLKIANALNIKLKDLFDYPDENISKEKFINLINQNLNNLNEKECKRTHGLII